MTTYTPHADALFDPGDPILASVALEARDNLIAVTEGGTSAPKIMSRALGIATGSDTITTGVSVFTSLDGAATIAVASEVTVSIGTSTAAATGTSRYRLSSDGGATYGGYVTLESSSVPATTTQPASNQESNVIAVDVATFDAIEFSTTNGTVTSAKIVFWAVQGET
jgi:hypothetical protein